jgi:hypothetical protein
MVQMRSVINLILSLTYVHPNNTNYTSKDAADVALEALAKQTTAKVVYSL